MTRDAEPADFVADVAAYFVARRGRGAMLSPADAEILLEWERAGAAAAAVKRGIDDAFRRGGDIRSLRQCGWAVAAALGKGRAVGAGAPAAGTDNVAARLGELGDALRAAAARTPGDVGRAAADAAAAVAALAATEGDALAAQAALDTLEDELFARVAARLGPAAMAPHAAAARAAVSYKNYPAEVAARTEAAIVRARLRAALGLPSFTL